MPDIDVNFEGVIASEVTRADLLTLIGSSTVKKKHYHITDAVNNTRKVAVFYRTNASITFWAYDVLTGQRGKYYIAMDLFIADLTPQGAVLEYVNFAAFPATGADYTIYIAQDTGQAYTWNGSSYDAIGSTVFAANFGALPGTGAADTLYITTDNGNSYLWDGSQYVLTSEGTSNDEFVQSITAGDDVTIGGTATDPTVGVTPHTFVRLPGTEVGFPITGPLQLDGAIEIYRGDPSGDKEEIAFDTGSLSMSSRTGTDEAIIGLGNGNSITVTCTASTFVGVQYAADYSANFTDRSLVDKAYVDNAVSGATGTSKFVIGGRNVSRLAASSSCYYHPQGGFFTDQTNDLSSTAFDNRSVTAQVPMTAKGITMNSSTAQPGTGSYVLALNVEEVDTALSLTIAAGSALGHYITTGTASIPQGDRYTIKAVNNASSNSLYLIGTELLIEI